MRNQQGVLLLLALVIMSIIVTAGLVLGTIITREVRLSTVSDKGITSLYGAETASEAAIFRIFKLGEDPTQIPTSGSMSGGSTWTRETKTTDRRFIFDALPEGETGEVNLYNTANANHAAGVESFSITWSSGTGIQVVVSEWDGTTLSQVSSDQFVCSGSPCAPIVMNTPVSNKAYQVTLTAVGAPITDLILSVFVSDGGTGDPVQVEIPLTVVSTGEYQGAKQAVQLRIPSPAPWGAGFTPPTPPVAVCGNTIVEAGEQCDDGNTSSGDGCSATCQTEAPPGPACGNSILDGAEFCDDGNATNAGTCNATCTALTYCGDGTMQNPNGFSVAETCDDGNTVSWDGCHNNCRAEAPNLAFSYVSHTPSCSNSPVTLQLTDNTGDPNMALGNYNFTFIGPVCSYINFTDTNSIVSSAAAQSGANDPVSRFFYITEQDGFGCSAHNLSIYDRELSLIRTAHVANPCTQINYTPGSYNPKQIANSIASQMGWSANPAGYLQFDFVSSANIIGCCQAIVTVKLVGNQADPSMALGDWTFDFAGPVSSYINFTDSQLVPTVVNSTGASDPNWRFVYISEQANMGCTPHTMTIYDRQMDSFRIANIVSPCTQINYTAGSYNPKQIAADIAAANGW